MSRTYRRKNKKLDEYLNRYSNYFESRGIDWYEDDALEKLPDREHYEKYRKALFRSDAATHCLDRSIPWWFRHEYSVWRRAHDKAEAKRLLTALDTYEYEFCLWKRDAGWDYW